MWFLWVVLYLQEFRSVKAGSMYVYFAESQMSVLVTKRAWSH